MTLCFAFSGPPIHRNGSQNRRAFHAQTVFVSGSRGGSNFYFAICFKSYLLDTCQHADRHSVFRPGFLQSRQHTVAAISADGIVVFDGTEKVPV